jgi:hypothetical protein
MGYRRLQLEALLLLWGVRLALWLFPFRVVGSRFHRHLGHSSGYTLSEVCSSLRSSGRFVPYATCLVQAIAAQNLLARYGYPSTVQVGVKMENNQLHAHAWWWWET